MSAGRNVAHKFFEQGSDISYGGVVWEFLDRFSFFKVNLRVMSKASHHVLGSDGSPSHPRWMGRRFFWTRASPATRGSPRTNHPRPHTFEVYNNGIIYP